MNKLISATRVTPIGCYCSLEKNCTCIWPSEQQEWYSAHGGAAQRREKQLVADGWKVRRQRRGTQNTRFGLMRIVEVQIRSPRSNQGAARSLFNIPEAI